MSYQTRRTKKDLEMECLKKGILENVNNFNTEGERVYKDDFIRALRDYYIKNKYNNNPPRSIELLDENLVSPMLASRFSQLKEDQQKEIWESDKWYLEEKEDGVRMLISFLKGEGFNFYSRNISVEDFLPISYGDTIYTEDIDKDKIKEAEDTKEEGPQPLRRGVTPTTEEEEVAGITGTKKRDPIDTRMTPEAEEGGPEAEALTSDLEGDSRRPAVLVKPLFY